MFLLSQSIPCPSLFQTNPASKSARLGSSSITAQPMALAPSRTCFKRVKSWIQKSTTSSLNWESKQDTFHTGKAVDGHPEPFPLKKSKPVLVRPAARTYKGNYYLTVLDNSFMFPLENLYSYKADGLKSTENACEVLKKALAEVLVHFHPLAGRLAMGEDGNFMVKCTGEGVYFVEAFIDRELDEFGDITTPNPAKLRPLLHLHEANELLDMPLLTVQVTMFRCGGFVIGTSINHCMMDGTSVGLFMKSWAEIAGGLPLSVPPFLDRSIMKPRQAEFPNNFFSKTDGFLSKKNVAILPDEEKVYTSVHFCPEKLMQLHKTIAEEEINTIPTNYELVTAFMSHAIIRSMRMEQPRHPKIFIPVNVRTKLGRPFPKGYFGNCVVFGYIRCNTEQFLDSSLSLRVKQVQEAIKLVTPDYLQSLFHYSETHGLQVSYENAYTFSNIGRLHAHELDFGWGKLKEFGFVTLPKNFVFFMPQKMIDRNSLTAVVGLPPPAMEIFQESMNFMAKTK